MSFEAATRINFNLGNKLAEYNYKVGIKNPTSTGGALDNIDLGWPNRGSLTVSSIFTTSSTFANQLFYICSRPIISGSTTSYENSVPRVTGVSQISLIKIPDVDITIEKGLNVNIVRNGNFEYNDCLDKINGGYGCQGTNKLLHWSANLIKNLSTTSISVQTS